MRMCEESDVIICQVATVIFKKSWRRLARVVAFMPVLFLFIPYANAEVFKCNNSGVISYSATPCASGSVAYPYNLHRISGASSALEGVISVRRGDNGGYNLNGSANGVPVVFLLDTGASRTTISGRVAYQLGVRSCDANILMATANGLVGSCRINLPRLTVDRFQFSNVDVNVALSMEQDALLGNDLLTRFKIEQQGGVMVLSR